MRAGIVAGVACLLCLSGCTLTRGSHTPSMEAAIVLRDANLPAMSVGDFRLASGLDPALDRSISSRGNPIHPPAGDSFSAYLRGSLIQDLKTAGKYDPAAPTRITGELTENSLATGISAGSSALAARFKVMRGDDVPYNKVLRQEDHWKSSFIGAVAIPDAINHYTQQYARLLEQLYGDDEFRRATSGR
jgi:hypothetical protein